jgi:hypothetical protein
MIRVCAAALSVLMVSTVAVTAQSRSLSGESPAPEGTRVAREAATVSKSLILQSTFIAQDIVPQAVANGYRTVHERVINCPTTPAGKCSVEVLQTVQVIGSTPENRVALGLFRNNTFVRSPYVGLVPEDFYVAYGFTQWVGGLAAGNHTLRSTIWTDDGATRGLYTIVYRIYKEK